MKRGSAVGYIVGLLIVTIVPILAYHFWTDKSPKIGYSLSGSTPTMSGDKSLKIQVLSVRNYGKEVATNVKVLLSHPGLEYRVIGGSQADNYQLFSLDSGGSEIVYERLPSSASFTVVLQGAELAISSSSIQISHDHGVGEYNATGKSNRLASAVTVFYMLLGLLYIVMVSHGIYSMSYEFKASFDPYKIVTREKPVFMLASRWRQIHKDASDKAFSVVPATYTEIQNLASYKILDSDQPSGMSEDSWREVVDDARGALVRQVGYLVSTQSIYSTGSYSSLEVVRPRNMPASEWEKVRAAIEERVAVIYYRKIQTWDEPNVAEYEKYAALFESDYLAELQKAFRLHVLSVIYARLARDPEDAVSRLNQYSQYVSEYDRDSVRELAQVVWFRSQFRSFTTESATAYLNSEKPSWIDADWYAQTTRSVKQFVDSVNEKDKFIELSDLLKSVLRDRFSGDRHTEALGGDDWKLVEELAADVSQAREDAIKLREERRTVLRQLEIIDTLFQDPTSIHRIEDYDNPFAQGNFEMLKRLADEM